MATEKTVNSEVFYEFLARLIANAEAPVFLIVDNHSVHRSVKVREYVSSTKGKLRLFHLPPYSPELNPDDLFGTNWAIITGDDFRTGGGVSGTYIDYHAIASKTHRQSEEFLSSYHYKIHLNAR